MQTHSSKAKISELNAASTSALSNAEALQNENRALQDEKIALEKENEELQAKLDELTQKLDEASQAEENTQAAENEMIKSLRTELDGRRKRMKHCWRQRPAKRAKETSRSPAPMQTLERLKDYLGQTALEEYKALGGE